MKRICLVFIFLTACTTVEFVRRDLVPTKHAILRYAPQSSPESEAKYRTKLDEKANEFCGGPFHITKEYEAREESPHSTAIGTGFGFGRRTGILVGGTTRGTTMYHFVEISCGAPAAATPAPTPAP
ncbi:MAG TPA: hypothetical protein VFV50_06540 [Bdellovibrionales bacterium]|nr:hypothetical protein [Bdellovibrionales bacterium]